MPTLGTTEIIIIALVIVLLFGAKKLPEAARGIGRSLRIFKAETKGLREDDADSRRHEAAPQALEPGPGYPAGDSYAPDPLAAPRRPGEPGEQR